MVWCLRIALFLSKFLMQLNPLLRNTRAFYGQMSFHSFRLRFYGVFPLTVHRFETNLQQSEAGKAVTHSADHFISKLFM